ncbi:MAG: FecR domain-containing protein [Bacteroidota bacterium]
MSNLQHQEELKKLMARYRTGEATMEEQAFMEQYDALFDKEAMLSEDMSAEEKSQWYETMAEDLERRLSELPATKVIPLRRGIRRVYRRISWAAAVLLLVAVGAYWLINREHSSQVVAHTIQSDVMPGKQRATLVLGNGDTVVIEKDQNGLLVAEGNMQVNNHNGELVYAGTNDGAMQYNQLITHKAEKSGAKLSDGTTVYVDASTHIKYPVQFPGRERVVELIEGQAYFEVAHDGRPFYVKHGNQMIQVLGTHFNVMAYGNESAMRVTLVEGSVKVSNGPNATNIVPGQQAVLDNNSAKLSIVEHADLEEATAWKDGKFIFHGVGIDVLLRQIERWYDVEVEVNGSLPEGTFVYEANRDSRLSELLRAFELNHVRFKIDGDRKKLTINP